MYKKEELLEMGRKLAEICRKTKENPLPNMQHLAAVSELGGYIKALQLSGIINEEEVIGIAKLALGEASKPNIPSAFAGLINGLNLDNLGSVPRKE